MAIDLRTGEEPTVTSLVSGIINDARDLLKQELALARREISDELSKAKQAVIALGSGIAVAAAGGMLLLLMLVHLLNEVGQIPLWICYAIVGAVLAVLGVGLFFLGKSQANQINLVPRQTVASMKENVQWIKNQT